MIVVEIGDEIELRYEKEIAEFDIEHGRNRDGYAPREQARRAYLTRAKGNVEAAQTLMRLDFLRWLRTRGKLTDY